jgi:hypothetical protein
MNGDKRGKQCHNGNGDPYRADDSTYVGNHTDGNEIAEANVHRSASRLAFGTEQHANKDREGSGYPRGKVAGCEQEIHWSNIGLSCTPTVSTVTVQTCDGALADQYAVGGMSILRCYDSGTT